MKVLKTFIREFSGDTETPITLFYKYVNNERGFLLESRGNGKTNFSFMGKNPMAILKGTDKLTVEENGSTRTIEGRLLEAVREYLSSYKVEGSPVEFMGGAVGHIGYDVIKQYENIPDKNPDTIGTPTVNLMVFKEFIIYDHLHDRIKLIVLEEEKNAAQAETTLDRMEKEIKASVPPEKYAINQISGTVFTSNTTKEEFVEKVNKCKKYIYDGDIFQVVPSQRFTAKINCEPLEVYRRLRAINPSPYLFYLNYGDYQVAGSSPEMLVELQGNIVKTCPIAGTRKRGKDIFEDAALAEDLRTDPKERAEHLMLVDLARNDMGRVAKIGSVKVTEFMQVHNYSHVMHLVSLVEGEKKDDEDGFSILSAFLPAGTLSGAPKIRAMEIIDELETEKRGIYGGAVGYFSFNGNMDTCIAIRTMVIKDGKVYAQSGAGIVADSVPENEFEECHNKVRALVSAIGGEIK